MRRADLEYWATSVLDQVATKQRIENTFVECKLEWPVEFLMTARQLAAHANAAHGEPILWLIGAKDDTGEIRTPKPTEVSNWVAQLKAKFDLRFAPVVIEHLDVAYKGATVIALLFETDRAPYVVRKGPGLADLEVTWREMGATRSATREDLLRLLMPKQKLPQILLVKANLQCANGVAKLSLICFITPPFGSQTTLTDYLSAGRILDEAGNAIANAKDFHFEDTPNHPSFRTLTSPQTVRIEYRGIQFSEFPSLAESVKIDLLLGIAEVPGAHVRLEAELLRTGGGPTTSPRFFYKMRPFAPIYSQESPDE